MYSVYGPRQALDNPYQGVLGIFLGNLLRNEPITIFGDGEQTRDFVYIGDVVRAWVTALDNKASFGQVMNIGSGQRQTINTVADAVLRAFEPDPVDLGGALSTRRPGEQRHVEADITRAKQKLGWEPDVSFQDGLAETVGWASRDRRGCG